MTNETKDTAHDSKGQGWTLSAWDDTAGCESMSGAYIILCGDKVIATLDGADYGQEACDYDFVPPEDMTANANLIAAAPDMAEVLEADENWVGDVILNAQWDNDTPTLTQAQWDRLIEIQEMRNAALSKARGNAG